MTKYLKQVFILFTIFYIVGTIVINFQNQILYYLFPEKIWIHRVDSIDKLKEVSVKFDAVELDIVFKTDRNIFDVNHPPAKSINLSLSEYLSSITLTTKKKFWLDFKNLSEKNINESSQKLDSICKAFKLNRAQFIVESTSHPKNLILFNKKGYKTSYYLHGTIDDLKIKQLKQNYYSYKTDYISSDKCNYKVLNKHFPNIKKLTWSFNYSEKKTLNPRHLYNNLKLLSDKYKLLSDKYITVVLFKYTAKKGNR